MEDSFELWVRNAEQFNSNWLNGLNHFHPGGKGLVETYRCFMSAGLNSTKLYFEVSNDQVL